MAFEKKLNILIFKKSFIVLKIFLEKRILLKIL